MEEVFINAIIYTLAIFGAIIFISDTLNIFTNRKASMKIVLLIDKNQENVQDTLNTVYGIFARNRLVNHIYVLFENENIEDQKIFEIYKKNNNFFIRIGENELADLINNKIYA